MLHKNVLYFISKDCTFIIELKIDINDVDNRSVI